MGKEICKIINTIKYNFDSVMKVLGFDDLE